MTETWLGFDPPRYPTYYILRATPADLGATAPMGQLAVTVSPAQLYVYIRGEGWVLLGAVDESAAPPASENLAGVAEIATQTEADTGTDDATRVGY